MNNVSLVGRLTRDPEHKELSSVNVCNFTLAVNRFQEGTDFIPIKVFGKQADSCRDFLGKGSQVGVEGSIQTGSYTKKDGTKVYTTDVVARKVEFLEPKKKQEDEYEGFHAYSDDDDDFVPF